MRKIARDLKLVNGTERTPKRPKKGPQVVPATARLTPPAFLSATAKREFRRVVREAGPALCSLDLMPLAGYCALVSRWQQAESSMRDLPLTVRAKNGAAYQNVAVGIANSTYRAMLTAAKELGITPPQRHSLGIVPHEPGSSSDTDGRYF